jgi:hypothetical protein
MIESALFVYSLARAARWFLHSGIQESSGGFARFYRSEIQKNMPVSTEISGYAAHALIFLYRTTKEEQYLAAARRTAAFLVDRAWDQSLRVFPYEYPSPHPDSAHLTYFFDSGIIVRGLIAVWEETREDRLLDIAIDAASGMSAFRSGDDYHPILTLPDKKPVPRTAQWSTAPGCYQAKSALAWRELAEITGDEKLRQDYLDVIESGMLTCRNFLAGADQHFRIMDRLHAYCYFLEALSPLLDRSDCLTTYAQVMTETATFLRELALEFARSDVYAQLLRARVRAAHVIPLNIGAAREEADALISYQAESPDPRFNGGFLFGKRDGVLSPHVNPVSTIFAIQALEMWSAFEAGDYETCLQPPI